MNPSFARLGLGLGIGFGSILTLALSNFWLLPLIEKDLDRRLQAWVGRMSIALHYESMQLRGFGIRVNGIRLTAHDIQAEGAAELRLSLRPDRYFLRPNHLVLDQWNVRWQRSRPLIKDAEERKANPAKAPHLTPTESISRMEKTLDLLLREGMTLELRSSTILILDAHRQELVTLPKLDLTFAASDQSLQVRAKQIFYRDHEILREIEGQLLLQKDKARFPFLMTARDTGNVPWQMQGSLSHDLDSLELRHMRQGLPGTWRPFLRWIGPEDSLHLLLKLSLQGLRRRDILSFDAQVASNNLELHHKLLGDKEWGPFPFSLRAKGDFQLETGDLRLASGLGHLVAHKDRSPIRVYFQASKSDLLAPMSIAPLRMSLTLPETPCQIFVDALPEHAFPLLKGFVLGGSVTTSAVINLIKDDEPVIKLSDRGFDCQLQSVPERFSKKWLLEQRTKSDPRLSNEDTPGLTALASPEFVPLSQIAETFLQGVISAEDGGFWKHAGFRWGSLQAALQANLKAGKVVYGGSTLTMQLVKNLYLSRERVLSRKVQELYLAWALEQLLSKEEILEIYANIVEFGPEMRGIGKASQGYFGKHPRDLNPAEALYLASILPSPHRSFAAHYCSGQLDEGILNRMQKTAEGVTALLGQGRWQRDYQESLRHLHFKPGSPMEHCERSLNIGLRSKSDSNTF